MKTTGLSGNEIYCLDKAGYSAGDIVVGNSVHALGFGRSIGSVFNAIVGGEVTQFTDLVEEGRATALHKMQAEAQKEGATGITGVTSELIFHTGTVEFLSIGSTVHKKGEPTPVAGHSRKESLVSTSSNGQDLYLALDCGYTPKKFVFGNVCYSIGITGGIIGALKTLVRGEVREFSDIFNTTRHLALSRIVKEAENAGANAVVGIETTILPFGGGVSGIQEMLMIGTAAQHSGISTKDGVVTSDLTMPEMWNLQNMGYEPVQLLLGTSVYSLGLVGGVTSFFKAFVKGEIPELTSLIYDARENALQKLNEQANAVGADEVVGVKTYVYQLGSGCIEFLAIGTGVKKSASLPKTKTDTLLPQAIIKDKDTFINTAEMSLGFDLNKGV